MCAGAGVGCRVLSLAIFSPYGAGTQSRNKSDISSTSGVPGQAQDATANSLPPLISYLPLHHMRPRAPRTAARDCVLLLRIFTFVLMRVAPPGATMEKTPPELDVARLRCITWLAS